MSLEKIIEDTERAADKYMEAFRKLDGWRSVSPELIARSAFTAGRYSVKLPKQFPAEDAEARHLASYNYSTHEKPQYDFIQGWNAARAHESEKVRQGPNATIRDVMASNAELVQENYEARRMLGELNTKVRRLVEAFRGLRERWAELEIGRSSTSYRILDEALREFEGDQK